MAPTANRSKSRSRGRSTTRRSSKPRRSAAPSRSSTRSRSLPSRKSSMSTGRQMMRVEGHGAGGTFTALTKVAKCPKYYAPFQYLARQTLQNVAGSNYTSGIGNQGQTSIGLGLGDDMRNLFAAANNTELLNTIATQKIFLQRMELLWTIRNDTNNEVIADIYDVVGRHDINAGSPTQDPSLAWALGDANSGSSSAFNMPGATPYSSPTFNQFFKVVKVHHVILPAGSTHEHRVAVVVNQCFNAAFWSAADGQPDFNVMKNFSKYTLIAWRGAPCGSTEAGLTSITNTRLDTTIFKKYTFTIPSVSASVVNGSNFLPAANYTPSFVNDESGLLSSLTVAA